MACCITTVCRVCPSWATHSTTSWQVDLVTVSIVFMLAEAVSLSAVGGIRVHFTLSRADDRMIAHAIVSPSAPIMAWVGACRTAHIRRNDLCALFIRWSRSLAVTAVVCVTAWRAVHYLIALAIICVRTVTVAAADKSRLQAVRSVGTCEARVRFVAHIVVRG